MSTRGLPGLAIVAAMALPGEAGAAPLPETALSQSLQMPTELIPGDEANQYLFPQHAAGAPAALLAFGGTRYRNVDGSGVRGRLRESSVSFLYVQEVPFATAVQNDDPPVYQLGWGRRAGGLRVGAAYSWSVRGDRARQTFTRTSSPFDRVEEMQSVFQTVGHHQAAIGFGWGSADTWSVDVVGELAWERLDFRYRDSRETLGSPYFLQIHEFLTTLSGDLLPGAALRVRRPIGSRARILGFGSYREISFDETRTIRSEFQDSDGSRGEERSETEHHHGREWSTGAALELGRDWRWIASAFWESRREAWRYWPRSDSAYRVRVNLESLRLGVATRFPIGEAITVRAGYAMTDRRWEEIGQTIYYGINTTATSSDRSVEDDVIHDFGWGATYSIRFLDLTGSMHQDLDLGDLFLALDVRARL